MRSDLVRTFVLGAQQRLLLSSQRKDPNSPHLNMAMLLHVRGGLNTDVLVQAIYVALSENERFFASIPDDLDAQFHVGEKPKALVAQTSCSMAEFRGFASRRCAMPLPVEEYLAEIVFAIHDDAHWSLFINLHHSITTAKHSNEFLRKIESEYSTLRPAADQALNPDLVLDLDMNSDFPALQTDLRTRSDRLYPRISSDLFHKLENLVEREFRLFSAEMSFTALSILALALAEHRMSYKSNMRIGFYVSKRVKQPKNSLSAFDLKLLTVDVDLSSQKTYLELFRDVAAQMMKCDWDGDISGPEHTDPDLIVNVIPKGYGLKAFADSPADLFWLNNGHIDAAHRTRLQLVPYAHPDAGGDRSFVLDVSSAKQSAEVSKSVQSYLGDVFEDIARDPNGTPHPVSPERHVQASFVARTAAETDICARLEQSLCQSEETAVLHNGRPIKGSEIWEQAEALGKGLSRAGIGSNARVAIDLDVGVDAVIAIYGTLISGASFVPLPQKIGRKRDVLDAAKPAITINSGPQVAELIEAGRSDGSVPDFHQASSEAYVLFTSGTSGKPKGIAISRAGLSHYITQAGQNYRLNEHSCAPLFGALDADLTITALFAPLAFGGQLKIYDQKSAAALRAMAADHDLNWCKATPSQLALMLPQMGSRSSLETIIVGGETFDVELAKALRSKNALSALINEYGPTECVVGSVTHVFDEACDKTGAVPIGRPIDGVRCVIVDPFGQDVLCGGRGELWINHPEMMMQYLGGADGPSSIQMRDSAPFYRSGDLVELGADGTLTFVGRIDDQINFNGHRIELAEVESKITRFDNIKQASVRLFSPSDRRATAHCTRCGLPNNVPGVEFNESSVCKTCTEFEIVEPQVKDWFGVFPDLVDNLQGRGQGSQSYDLVLLLSGGKDSTYALYKLAGTGFRILAVTLDNGFLSQVAKENIARCTDALDVDHEYLSTPNMTALFKNSLESHSNVCNGCYKTLYSLATARALELGVPSLVTGLSRGQLFETRLHPQMFEAGSFDSDRIDTATLNARKAYHRRNDFTNQVLKPDFFFDDQTFEKLEYFDFYRFVDIDLDTVLTFLNAETPWERPKDSGRSTNCLINAAGIYTHLKERGYHNYAVPYAWDVRLGHKTRADLLKEINDDFDVDAIQNQLDDIGYAPKANSELTAWVTLDEPDQSLDEDALRQYLFDLLPTASIPTKFVSVESFPLDASGKVAHSALPAPHRTPRTSKGFSLHRSTGAAGAICEIWEQFFVLAEVTQNDNFFAIGGDSIKALEMSLILARSFDRQMPDHAIFSHSTPRSLWKFMSEVPMNPENTLQQIAPDKGLTANPTTYAIGSPPDLSIGEKALLFLEKAGQRDQRYNVGKLYIVEGDLDYTKYEEALFASVACHTTLTWSYLGLRQPLSASVDLSVMHTEQALADFITTARDCLQTDFDLEAGPLLRCNVAPLPDNRHAVFFCAHHVACDNKSFEVLWASIWEHMKSGALTAPVLDFAQFNQLKEAQDFSAAENYWKSFCAQDRPRLSIPLPARNAETTYLEQSLSVTKADIQDHKGGTTMSLAMAALAKALVPLSDKEAVEIGIVLDRRDSKAARSLVGNFLNVAPVLLHCPAGENLSAMVQSATQALSEVVSHRDYPFSKVQSDCRQNNVDPPASQVLLSIADHSDLEFGETRITREPLAPHASLWPLAFFVVLRNDIVSVAVHFDSALVSASLSNSLLIQFGTVLEQEIAGAPKTAELSPQQSVLIGPAVPRFPSVLEEIEKNFSDRAGKPAIHYEDETIAWDELGDLSNAVASRLIDYGVKPGDRVAIVMARSKLSIPTILGTLLAGASYVPIDPKLPEIRILEMLERAGIKTMILDTGLAIRGLSNQLRIDYRDFAGHPWSAVQPTKLPPHDPKAEAYTIFTSGITGAPKGVSITHAMLSQSTFVRSAEYVVQPDKFLLLSDTHFDSSMVGLFWTLGHGGTVTLASESRRSDIDGIVNLMTSQNFDYMLCVPSLYQMLLIRRAAVDRALWPRNVIVAGEALAPSIYEDHLKIAATYRLINEYGPSEATVWVSKFSLGFENWNRIPIGLPIAGVTLRVVDGNRNVLPQGFPGEIEIISDQVADGYLGADQEDHKFYTIEHGQNSGRRAFLTGDLGVVEDGLLHFLARKDALLNLSGQRIDASEIENALIRIDGVTQAVVTKQITDTLEALMQKTSPVELTVLMQQAAQTATPAETLHELLMRGKELPSTLVAHIETTPLYDEGQVRRQLGLVLPDKKRPRNFYTYQKLPRTSNGKIDRSALSSALVPTQDKPPSDGNSPIDAPLLEDILNVFRVELNRPDLPADGSIFDFGADSIIVLNLTLALESRLSKTFATTSLFESPSAMAFFNTVRDIRETASGPGEISDFSRLVIEAQRRLLSTWTAGKKQPESLLFFKNANGKKRPLFWCFQGDVELSGMAKSLDPGIPIYAMRSAFLVLDGTDEVVEELARIYADEILSIDPSGEIVIGGNCQGSRMATAVANELIARGHQPARLILLEEYGYHAYSGKVDLIYGEESSINPFNNKIDPTELLNERYDGGYSIEFTTGGHGQYFVTHHVRSIKLILERILASIEIES